MGDATLTQTSFLSGEWSQTMQGRIDRQDYRTAMAVCRNALPTETGAWTRRPGFRYGNHTRGGSAGRIITWSFQETTPYTIEVTNGFMRFHAGTRLATTNDAVSVTAISSAKPAVAQLSAARTWPTGSEVYLTGLGTTDPYLENRQFVMTVIDTTHFSLTDAITGDPLDGALLATFTTGQLCRIAELAVPYTDAQWPTLRVVQAETKAVVLQGEISPRVLEATPPSGTDDATFTLTTAQFVDGPYLDPALGATLTPASSSGIIGFTMISPTWSSTVPYNTGDYVTYSSVVYQSLIDSNLNHQPNTATFAWAVVTQDRVVGPNGLQDSDIGRHIRLFSEPTDWAIGTAYNAGVNVKYNYAYYTSVVGSNIGNVPGSDVSKWIPATNGARWTWGKVVSLTGATAVLIDPGAGTLYGNLNTLNFAFDGLTDVTFLNCAKQTALSGSVTNFSVGKVYSPGKAVSYAVVTAPNDRGLVTWISAEGEAAGSITLNLRGKNSLPANTSDGTLLGALNNASNARGASAQIFSNDVATTFAYLWVEIVAVRGKLTDYYGVYNCTIAEVQFYQTSPFSGTGISVQVLGPDLLYTTPIKTWRLGLLRPGAAYPKCGTYHEGRLWLSGIVSNRLDASALIDINGNVATTLFNFTPTTQDGTISDACAINYTLNGPDVNAVFWMEPDEQGIIAGTQAGEWLIRASTLNSPLTPVNMQAHRATKIGCANIEPRRTDHTTVFTQTQQHKIMEYFSDIFSGKFSAPNLTEKAMHLATRGIAELAYQKGTTPVLWARCLDGSLIGAAYKRDSLMQSQGPTYIAWHLHTLGSGRTIESIAVGPSAAAAGTPAGLLDTLAILTTDVSGVRHVEFMTGLFEETTSESAAWHLDNAVSATVTAGFISGPATGVRLSGLWHLNGKTVNAFVGGVDCGQCIVANGSTFVPYITSNPLFTSTLIASFSGTVPAVVGYVYNSDGQIVRPATAQETQARLGPTIGTKRRADQYAALAVNTQDISFGTSFDHLKPAQFRTPGNRLYAENVLFTGIHWDSLSDDYGFDGMLCWRASGPYPATIAAVTLFLQQTEK